jgi:hypothetical protein
MPLGQRVERFVDLAQTLNMGRPDEMEKRIVREMWTLGGGIASDVLVALVTASAALQSIAAVVHKCDDGPAADEEKK